MHRAVRALAMIALLVCIQLRPAAAVRPEAGASYPGAGAQPCFSPRDLAPFLQASVPLDEPTSGPAEPRTTRRASPVKAVYVTGHTASNRQAWFRILELLDETELNGVVVDVKDCSGRTTYSSTLPAVIEANASGNAIEDLVRLVRVLKRRGVYAIARLVVFRDPRLALSRTELAVKRPSGTIWRDRRGGAWTDPYSGEVWDYNLAIAREVAEAGFDEIQFDYVRFPTGPGAKSAVYPARDERSFRDAISGFLDRAREELSPMGVAVAADIFGLVPSAEDDLGIGQYFEDLAARTDYVCPMMYPSHYAPNSYGIPDPDARPYETVLETCRDAVERLQPGFGAVRPWIQDFSLRHRYEVEEVRQEIRAVYDSGLEGWMLWNPRNEYTLGALEAERRPRGGGPSIR